MAPVKRKRAKRKNFGSNAPKRGGRRTGHGKRYQRRNVDPETVFFVKGCLLPSYKKARGWGFLKPGEKGSVNAIAIALVKHQIVTGTMKATVMSALIELDFQGHIKLPPPLATGRRKQ